MARKRMINAINEALQEEMRRDPDVILFGEDVRASIMGDTRGLFAEFGEERVRDTPICEQLITGMAVGAAATGKRPVCHMMYGNFMYTGFDAIANQAAKLRYMTGGQIGLPLVYMGVFGGGRSSAAQHSDAMHPIFMNLGGIKVVLPSTPGDAKGLLKSAIRDNNPVIFLQAAGRGGESGEVPEEDYTIPLGVAEIKRDGKDVTVVAIGAMVRPALRAAGALADEGIECEVIDPRTVHPLDEDAILASVERTGRLVVVDEARDACSAASHIAAIVADKGFRSLEAPIRRVTVANVAIPYAPPLEKAVIPDPERIALAVRAVMQG
jgi:acetoin:2,6-dichlorophenolindophenol oxidoreductase subunit beta